MVPTFLRRLLYKSVSILFNSHLLGLQLISENFKLASSFSKRGFIFFDLSFFLLQSDNHSFFIRFEIADVF
jgi:hypothetical protein